MRLMRMLSGLAVWLLWDAPYGPVVAGALAAGAVIAASLLALALLALVI